VSGGGRSRDVSRNQRPRGAHVSPSLAFIALLARFRAVVAQPRRRAEESASVHNRSETYHQLQARYGVPVLFFVVWRARF
jgi:hypothetical protein